MVAVTARRRWHLKEGLRAACGARGSIQTTVAPSVVTCRRCLQTPVYQHALETARHAETARIEAPAAPSKPKRRPKDPPLPLKVYRLWFDGDAYVVEAISVQTAISVWQTYTDDEGNDFGDEEPESVEWLSDHAIIRGHNG